MMESDLILSDVHSEKIATDNASAQMTRFKFRIPPSTDRKNVEITRSCRPTSYSIDQDGDFEFETDSEFLLFDVVRLHHHMSTNLTYVGLQVWKGSLIMCDYILHHNELFQGKNILELGAGTGLTGIAVAQYAASVMCTDKGDEILNLCRKNFSENASLINSLCVTIVQELDWNTDFELCIEPDYVLAADCIYDDDLTDALFRTLLKIFSDRINPSTDCANRTAPTVLLSLEKRLNFTIDEYDVTCQQYDHFQESLQQLGDNFTITKLEVDNLPLYFNYDRTKYLELWSIEHCRIQNLS